MPTTVKLPRKSVLTWRQVHASNLAKTRGVITDVTNVFVLVRYGDDRVAKATAPQLLEWEGEAR